MKFAILSLVAAGGLALSTGTASAHPPGYGGGYSGGYNRGFHPITPHLDYHRGHYHYHDGFYRSGPLVPVYPSYNYGYNSGYNSGFGLSINRPGFNFNLGSGYSQPYYGGGYYGGRRW
jgi:hypothetical protein